MADELPRNARNLRACFAAEKSSKAVENYRASLQKQAGFRKRTGFEYRRVWEILGTALAIASFRADFAHLGYLQRCRLRNTVYVFLGMALVAYALTLC